MGTIFYVQNNDGARLGSTSLGYLVQATYLVIDGTTVADPNNGVYIPTSLTNPTLTSPTLYSLNGTQGDPLPPEDQEASTQELIVPTSFNVNNTVFFADALDSDGLTAAPIPTGSLAWYQRGALAFFENKYGLNTVEQAMVSAFAAGGTQDLQRTYDNIGGFSNGGAGPFVKAFIDAASYNLGLTAYLSGIPLWAVELGGGLYNHFSNPSGNQSGVFFNSAVNAELNTLRPATLRGHLSVWPEHFRTARSHVVDGIDTITNSDHSYMQVTSTSTSITLNFFNASNQPTSTSVLNINGSETDTTYQVNAGIVTNTTNVYNTSQNLTEVITTEPTSLSVNVTQMDTNYTGTNNDAVDGYVFDFGDGNSITFDAGTSGTPSYSDSSSAVNIGLTTSGGLNLGTLTFNASTDADSFTLTNGLTIALPDISGDTEVASDPGDTPFGTLQSYLSDLGYDGNISTANYNHFNPTGTAYDVDGVVTGVAGSNWLVAYVPSGPGAVMAGQDTATDFGITADAYNYAFVANGGNADFSNDTLTGIQALTLGTGSAAFASMTASQFNDFTALTGAGVITITTSGTASLAGPGSGGDDGDSDDDDVSEPTNDGTFDLVAQGWGGTNLIGNNANGQILQASQFGDDSLTEGNGNDDVLIAGEGVDHIKSGTGTGDQFSANDGLAAGSVLEADGTDATLTASDDISGATISGISQLQVGSGSVVPPDITMTSDEFNGIASIYSIPGAGTAITINDDSVYSIDADNLSNADNESSTAAYMAFGATDTTIVTIDATNSAAQYNTYDATGGGNITLTLDGNGGQGIFEGTGLVASGSGNDTLTATSSGGGYSLSATGSGNDTLTVGDGSGDGLSATGAGTDTLTAGFGANDTLSASGDGFYTLVAGDGSGDGLSLNASDSSISAEGNTATISVTGSDNIVGASGFGDTITAQGGFNTINTFGGGATVNLSDTDNDISGGSSGGNTYNTDATGVEGLVLNGGSGGGNVLNVDDTVDLTQAEISNVTLSGMGTLIAGDGDLTPLTGLSFAGGGGTVQATEAGTYNVASLDTSDQINMEDTSTTGGVTLIDNNVGGDELTGGTSDTFTAGSGAGDTITAEGADDTVTAGNGAGDSLLATAASLTATLGNGAGDGVEIDGNNGTVALGTGSGDIIFDLGLGNTITAHGSGAAPSMSPLRTAR